MDALQDQIDTAIAESVRETDDTVSLKLSVLEKASPIVVERVLYHGWNLLGLPEGMRLPYRNVQLIYNKISAGWEESRRMSVSGTILVRKNDSLVWQIEEPALAEGYVSCVYSDCIELDGTYRLLVGGEPTAIVPVEKRARIASESLTPPVVVRSYQSGDAIRLVEGTKKVVSLFSDWHIAPEQRWRIPVLEDAKGIFAVLGGAYGGKDRVAVRCLSAPLARNHGTLYSVTDREG
jgi:tRNA(Ile)-lysidine synthetase-like protein